MAIIRSEQGKFYEGNNRFRYIGINKYTLHVNTLSQASVQSFFDACVTRGIRVVRTWCFDSGYMPSNSAGNFRYLSGGTLLWREATFTHLDMVLDEARQRGIKLILVLGDNPTYNTKNTYIRWSDAIYGTDYFTPVSKSISSASLTNNVITVTTTDPHGFHVGQIVNTSGANEASFNNNTVFIRSVPSPTTFTYSKTASNQTATGTMSVIRNSSYKTQNFWRDANCKQMYKDFFNKLATRTNTVNGRVYKEDDSIFAWEMFNEGRYDQDNDPGINSQNSHNLSVISGNNGRTPTSYQYSVGWAEEMADHFKSVDPNHLVTYGSMAHTWQWVNGDTISNGTYYGVDYDYLSAIDNIDYLSFHIYPTQGDNIHLQKYGQRLGYSNDVSGEGFRDQLRDFVAVGKGNNKPVVLSEIGFIRENIGDNTYFPLYPRATAFSDIFSVMFEEDADGIIPWHGEITDGGTYSINLVDWNGVTTNLNYNDTYLQTLIQDWNNYFTNNYDYIANSYRGIAVSGLEFTGSFDSNTQGTYNYIARKGFNLVRLSFNWNELQPDLNGDFNETELDFIQDNIDKAELMGLKVILDMHNYGRRYVSGNGGITEPFTNTGQRNLLTPYNTYDGSGYIILRNYGQGLMGTFSNPVSPATGYTVTVEFKFDSKDDSFGGEGLYIKPMWQDDNNCYELGARMSDNTWQLNKVVNGVRTQLATGSKTWGTSTTYTIVLDVNQGTNGKINATLDGVALWTNNTINSDNSLLHGKVALYPQGVHVRIYGDLILNVNGNTSAGNATEYRVTDAQLPISAWNDFWGRLSDEFKDNETVIGYDHNEPYSMPIPTSTTNYSQAVANENDVPVATNTYMIQQMLNTIRANGDNKYIVAEYDFFANTHRHTELYTANPVPWIIDTLSPGKVIYSSHYYPDADHSGTFVSPTIRSLSSVESEITPAFAWAQSRGVPFLLGEVGIPADEDWEAVLEKIYDLADEYDIWVTYWAAGDSYSSETTIQPESTFTVDKLQMETVKNHLGEFISSEETDFDGSDVDGLWTKENPNTGSFIKDTPSSAPWTKNSPSSASWDLQ